MMNCKLQIFLIYIFSYVVLYSWSCLDRVCMNLFIPVTKKNYETFLPQDLVIKDF